MQHLFDIWQAAQQTYHAHATAVHNIQTALTWLRDGVGLLRTLEWVRNKISPTKDQMPKDPQDKQPA